MTDLRHIVCCDEDLAFCGEDLTDQPWEATERTEPCLTCLVIESDLNRKHRGCGSPLCPHRPWEQRLFRLLWRWLSLAWWRDRHR